MARAAARRLLRAAAGVQPAGVPATRIARRLVRKARHEPEAVREHRMAAAASFLEGCGRANPGSDNESAFTALVAYARCNVHRDSASEAVLRTWREDHVRWVSRAAGE